MDRHKHVWRNVGPNPYREQMAQRCIGCPKRRNQPARRCPMCVDKAWDAKGCGICIDGWMTVSEPTRAEEEADDRIYDEHLASMPSPQKATPSAEGRRKAGLLETYSRLRSGDRD